MFFRLLRSHLAVSPTWAARQGSVHQQLEGGVARTRPKGASPLANCGPVPWASATASSLHIGGESTHGVAVEMKWHKSVWRESRIWVSGSARWTRVTLPLLCRLRRPLVVEERVGTSPPPAQPVRWEAGVCAVFHHEGKTESQSGDEPARGARPVGAEAEVALKALQSCRMSEACAHPLQGTGVAQAGA